MLRRKPREHVRLRVMLQGGRQIPDVITSKLIELDTAGKTGQKASLSCREQLRTAYSTSISLILKPRCLVVISNQSYLIVGCLLDQNVDIHTVPTVSEFHKK